jgi:HEAT repeat protein
MGLFKRKMSKELVMEKDIQRMERERDVEGLLGALALEESNARLVAILALANLHVKDSRAVEPLAAALMDRSSIVRFAALALFTDYIDDPRAVPSLLSALAVEKDPEVKSHLEAQLVKAVEKASVGSKDVV